MESLKSIVDPYDRKARLYPALLLLVPAIVLVITYTQTVLSLLQLFIPIVVSCGAPFLLTQLVRDRGKKKEGELYKDWDGMPSVTIFRYLDNRLDSVTKARYHEKMASLCQTSIISREEEQTDRNAADSVYTAWSTYLRGQTRNKQKFHLLFQENINYGFRRNMFGIRHIGMITSFSCSFIALVWMGNFYLDEKPFIVGQFISIATACLFLIYWKFFCISDWVHVSANAYAERLVETIDLLCEVKR